MEYIRRFGRWRPNTFSLYLHFDDKLLRKLSSCLTQCEALTSQLMVCTEGANKVEFDKKGDMAGVTRVYETRVGDVGHPASLSQEKRTGSKAIRVRRQKSRRRKDAPKQVVEDVPNAMIDDGTIEYIKKAKMLRGIKSHPEYAHDADGLDASMDERTLYYAIQGRVFAGEALISRNFRLGKTLSRNVRRARVTAGKIPAGQSTLEEYQEAYRKYINHRRKIGERWRNSRGENAPRSQVH